MFRPHWINPAYFLVRINKEQQRKKRETLGEAGILVADVKNTFMQNNMQYGEVVMIGEKAGKYLPQTTEGDNLIFSHFIEGSVQSYDSKGQAEFNEEYKVPEDIVGETGSLYNYYFVPTSEAYAVSKSDGNIFVAPNVIFAEAHNEEIGNGSLVQLNSGIFLFDNYKSTADEWLNRIQELKETMQQTTSRAKQIEYVTDMERLTGELNKKRVALFHPLYVNENFNRDCGRKISNRDVLYYELLGSHNIELQCHEVSYKGRKFIKLNPRDVLMVGNGEPLSIENIEVVATSKGELQERIHQ